MEQYARALPPPILAHEASDLLDSFQRINVKQYTKSKNTICSSHSLALTHFYPTVHLDLPLSTLFQILPLYLTIPDLPHLIDKSSRIIHRLQKALINPTTFFAETSLSGRLHNALQLRPCLQDARSRTALLPRFEMNCSCLDQSHFSAFHRGSASKRAQK